MAVYEPPWLVSGFESSLVHAAQTAIDNKTYNFLSKLNKFIWPENSDGSWAVTSLNFILFIVTLAVLEGAWLLLCQNRQILMIMILKVTAGLDTLLQHYWLEQCRFCLSQDKLFYHLSGEELKPQPMRVKNVVDWQITW